MKNLFKKMPLIYSLIAVFVVSAVIIYWLTRSGGMPQTATQDFITTKVEQYKDELKKDRARIETNSPAVPSAFKEDEIAALEQALKIERQNIKAITKINGTLKDSIKLIAVTLDAERNKVWNWEKKYPSGSTITAVMNEKDSILHPAADISLLATDYVDKGFLKRTKYYTDLYSPDQNILINGVKTYRREKPVTRQRFGVGVQFGYGMGENFKPAPYVGIGISYNLFSF